MIRRKSSLFSHTKTFYIYKINILVELKIVYKQVPTDKNIHILLREQVVYKRGTKMEEDLLDNNGQYNDDNHVGFTVQLKSRK